MTTTMTIEEAQIKLRGFLATAREGDEILIEECGEKIAKIVPTIRSSAIETRQFERRIKLGLREGKGLMSDDFDKELPG